MDFENRLWYQLKPDSWFMFEAFWINNVFQSGQAFGIQAVIALGGEGGVF